MSHIYQTYLSRVGLLYLVERENMLKAVIFEKNWPIFKKKLGFTEEKNTSLLNETKKQLDQYFKGERKTFNIPYKLDGTKFQNLVWEALVKIPFGHTKSYKEHALSVDAPKAVRAIGRTNGLNPISIILPCHRVIGSSGDLTGYGGGIEVKKFLLDMEKAVS